MYIPMVMHKIITTVDANQRLKRQDTLLNEPTNQSSIIVLKVVKLTNKKKLLLNFGDQCNKPEIQRDKTMVDKQMYIPNDESIQDIR